MNENICISINSLESIVDVNYYLNTGAVLVTATPQLATDWKRRLVVEGSVSETPYILSWHHWLNELAGKEPELPVPLNALQELELWQRVIAGDMSGRLTTAALRGMARCAAAAFVLIREYDIDPDDLATGGEEAEALHRWLSQFEHLCDQCGRVAAADIGRRLLPLIGGQEKQLHILLDGFEELTPLQKSILQQFERGGGRISRLGHAGETPTFTLSSLADVESEYRHVATTLQARLAENPEQRIAIVTAGQPTDADILRRTLDETLLPNDVTLLPIAEQAVSMSGEPLAGMPLVRQLLQLLSLAGSSGASFADFSRLLLSPVLGGFEAEARSRAQLDAWLRENRRHYLSFNGLLATEQMRNLPGFAAILQTLQTWESTPRSAAGWVKAVHLLLKGCGCLEIERGRSAAEVRQLNSFRDALSSIVAIDALTGDIDWSTFLLLLREQLSVTTFALPARYPQVTVLSLDAIPGLRFDAVLAVGFDEDTLPIPAEARPLLSPALTRKYRLPSATPELAFATSGFLWQQLRQAAPQLDISYARQRDDRELAVSPLLADLPELRQELPAADFRQAHMESFDDAPAVPMNSGEQVGGGSGIIRSQSACPFRAFATHRLAIAPLGETEPGLDAATKGSLIHLALEFIWQELRSQQRLLELNEAGEAELIAEAVAYAMRECRTVMAESSREQEQARLRQLLSQWLEIERQRPAFTVVEREKWFEMQLPAEGDVHFPIRLQADRIDRDEAGHTILIDYKSGRKQSPKQWLGERMAEPQLPLYAVAAGLGEQDAVCFARLRSSDMGFEGLSGESVDIKNIVLFKGNEEAATWPELLTVWRQRIDELAAEFVAGRSDVAPRDTHACDYCCLEAVCRIDETGFDADADREEEQA